MPKGVYKEIGGWAGQEDSAHMIDSGGHEWDVPKSRYLEQRYEPAFDTLPTKEEYEARNA